MKLNKEKHLESYCDIMKGFYIREDVLNYGKLIEEYFDNPPLKFEELEEDMWVWDRRDNKYVHIYMTRIYEYDTGCFFKGQKLLRIYCDSGWYDTEFVENRFYRKQVE